jgi:hypothetical protein
LINTVYSFFILNQTKIPTVFFTVNLFHSLAKIFIYEK